MENVTETDLTMEQAMSMIMTGGAVGPETIRYSKEGREEVGATQTVNIGTVNIGTVEGE